MQEKTIGTFFIRLTFYFVSLVSVTKYVFATEVDGLAERVCAQGDDLHAGAALQRDMPEEEAPHLSEQLAQTTPLVEPATSLQRDMSEEEAPHLFAEQLAQTTPTHDTHLAGGLSYSTPTHDTHLAGGLSYLSRMEEGAIARRAWEEKRVRDLVDAELAQIAQVRTPEIFFY